MGNRSDFGLMTCCRLAKAEYGTSVRVEIRDEDDLLIQ